MIVRSILVPTLIVCAIAAPILFSQHQSSQEGPSAESVENDVLAATMAEPSTPETNQVPVSSASHFTLRSPQSTTIGTPSFQAANSSNAVGFLTQNPVPLANANGSPNPTPFGLVSNQSNGVPNTSPALPANSFGVPTQQFAPPTNYSNMKPDLLAAQTVVYPGNRFGPDLTAQPLEFLPITDFNEIFRFDISPEWITQRWKRVSTRYGDKDLHGFRVALVTGINSWDLHGSLTYYFDVDQRPQKITFRGWTGDATPLTNILTNRFNFKRQPSHLAGFYLAKSWGKSKGGLLMKHPEVISQDNPHQRLGIVLEINNPDGSFALSSDFQSMIEGSHPR